LFDEKKRIKRRMRKQHETSGAHAIVSLIIVKLME
jgi:hypothetical protein